MERKVGEKFLYKGTMLEVVEQSVENKDISRLCKGCYFYENYMLCYSYRGNRIVGECSCYLRPDRKEVLFKEIKK